MTGWLTGTLLYTGLLIVLVLALRRPVARIFGPQAAYALWLLPLLRFFMPPIVLPASFAPAGPAEAASTLHGPAPAFATGLPVELLSALALALWLTGAAAFLLWRGHGYLRMRENLLAGARPVGEAGDVRLVETPAVSGPVAFGVFDKVVALPMGFMAIEDVQARDLAIAHELAHHRGRDLLANMFAQPVLALHWFDPVAWIGWRAMRRDQEAACDARVMAGRSGHERAVYARMIAGFAAGPRLALAAPMACPMASPLLDSVWGEKSIVHRLRSLRISGIPRRRRLAGQGLLAGAALALPLTASISYSEAPPAPLAMVKPDVVPALSSASSAPVPDTAPRMAASSVAPDAASVARSSDARDPAPVVLAHAGADKEMGVRDGEWRAFRSVVIAPANGGAMEIRQTVAFSNGTLSDENLSAPRVASAVHTEGSGFVCEESVSSAPAGWTEDGVAITRRLVVCRRIAADHAAPEAPPADHPVS